MARNVTLLLTENVDNLGIVGDVVNVRLGYARNYLLPHGYATEPSDDMIKALADKRAEAERMLAELRKDREALIAKLQNLEMTLQRPCNDQGILYGSVTQQDISAALRHLGYNVRPREVRLPHTIKRVDDYEILVKFSADLETTIKVWVVADRDIDSDEREEMEFDNEGELIVKSDRRPARQTEDAPKEDAPAEAPAEG